MEFFHWLAAYLAVGVVVGAFVYASDESDKESDEEREKDTFFTLILWPAVLLFFLPLKLGEGILWLKYRLRTLFEASQKDAETESTDIKSTQDRASRKTD